MRVPRVGGVPARGGSSPPHANKLAALALDQESPGLTLVARTQARRSLFTTAAGKTLLASVPDEEMHRLLKLAGAEQAGEVRQFLVELPEIRSRRPAFNRGAGFADAFAVATPWHPTPAR
ncbi:hypothetical protein OHA27_34270 [Streptomyces sp. NBC_01619]|uniref:IclR family transcriptional regulator domain-containing protein n=1 Tax=unclassified Streptomyces TaxID=2593676 RepID=UPI00224FCABC|nr:MULTISPECIES: IclR family transcriptional regulator C-terminal domain-containing protein [unclassified Streptomyces]MCX4515298.1 hypothetical protein [Streptomyces sp. NBC_01619]